MGDMERLEEVQRRATRMMGGGDNFDYENRLRIKSDVAYNARD